MLDRKPDFLDPAHQRQREMALSRSESKGDVAPEPAQEDGLAGAARSDAPLLTNAELVQLQIRMIALENLVIALLAEASDKQLELAREMAAYIAPRPGFTRHHLTVHGAAQMISLVERAAHFRDVPPT